MKRFGEPILVTKSFLPPMEEYIGEIQKIWQNSWITNQGPVHNKFRNNLNSYLKTKYCTLFVNGHSALDIALKSFILKGEVITTPFTFASTSHAISMNGLKPVFCDINLHDYNIDTDKIESLITKQTAAILPVHVFGNPCNVQKIEQIAQKYNLKVIYDAAHAFGVEINDRGIASFGDVSMISLHATKVFHSIEGGVLAFANNEYEKKFDLLKNFGITGPETVEEVGLNAKMNEFQAAMGLINLRHVDDIIAKRKLITEEYRKLLACVPGIVCLKDMDGVKHNYAYLPVLVDEEKFGMTRNELYEELKEYNIFARKYFYPLISDFDCYKDNYKDIDIPVARYVGERVMTLPIYDSLSLESVQKICEIIAYLNR